MRWRWALAGLVLLSVAVTLLWRVPVVRSWARDEIDWRGQRLYQPPHAPAPDQVDLRRVHTELLPHWLIARSRRTRGLGASPEEAAFKALRAAVAPDPNLAMLLDELHDLSAPSRLAEDPRRALYLSWAWSHYLGQHQAPFLIQGTIRGSKLGPIFSAGIYEIHSNAMVGLGSSAYRVQLVSRIDRTNLREQYLGAAGHDGAVLVIDRLLDFAAAEVWPLLDPWLELELDGRRNFAGPVRAEARRQLSAAALDRLAASAKARWAITRTLRAIERRRAACGSGFRINDVPWSGFSEERLGRLEDVALRHAERACPGITLGEVWALGEASEALHPDPELLAALQELVAWTAQHVAVHEARHLADDGLVEGFDEPLACASCAEHMGISSRAELSGYLASMAWSPSPTLALYQACRSLAGEHGRITAAGEPHREALKLFQRRVGPVCLDGPPPELRALARHLEVEMLGRSEVMALPTDFPTRLPVQ
ncbi:MAG: hypothetical protein AAGF11_02375 [Myxococcota bacterium]